ncbi:MAG: hypothetical protein Q8Q56_00290 [Alphaproteobacteria bacterium]|nr:hypothetical protein [Alphaproteobacteria bacterium]
MRWLKQLRPQQNRKKGATTLNMEALKQDIEQYPDMRISMNGHTGWE